jgi:hypothetical protein
MCIVMTCNYGARTNLHLQLISSGHFDVDMMHRRRRHMGYTPLCTADGGEVLRGTHSFISRPASLCPLAAHPARASSSSLACSLHPAASMESKLVRTAGNC